jgi:large subunit ribosomal protein L13Ae
VYRNKVRFMSYLNKRVLTNPNRGPFHKRSPSMMLKKAIRGMIKHKVTRGQLAMKRLRVWLIFLLFIALFSFQHFFVIYNFTFV